jgi:hypothetical protein
MSGSGFPTPLFAAVYKNSGGVVKNNFKSPELPSDSHKPLLVC